MTKGLQHRGSEEAVSAGWRTRGTRGGGEGVPWGPSEESGCLPSSAGGLGWPVHPTQGPADRPGLHSEPHLGRSGPFGPEFHTHSLSPREVPPRISESKGFPSFSGSYYRICRPRAQRTWKNKEALKEMMRGLPPSKRKWPPPPQLSNKGIYAGLGGRGPPWGLAANTTATQGDNGAW